MKSLITAAASLMILLAFLVQFTHSQMLQARLLAADRTVSAFRETARQEGCISEREETRLKKAISEILECEEEEVLVEASRTAVLRGGCVFLRVQAPVRDVVILGGFWKISEEKNNFVYRVSYTAASEYTGRDV